MPEFKMTNELKKKLEGMEHTETKIGVPDYGFKLNRFEPAIPKVVEEYPQENDVAYYKIELTSPKGEKMLIRMSNGDIAVIQKDVPDAIHVNKDGNWIFVPGWLIGLGKKVFYGEYSPN